MSCSHERYYCATFKGAAGFEIRKVGLSWSTEAGKADISKKFDTCQLDTFARICQCQLNMWDNMTVQSAFIYDALSASYSHDHKA